MINPIIFIHKMFEIPRNFETPSYLSNKTIQILQELRDKIRNVQHIECTPTINKGLGLITSSVNCKYLPKKVFNIGIFSKLCSNAMYNFQLPSGRMIYLCFIYESFDKQKQGLLYKNIRKWLHVLDDIANTHCSRTLKIYIILTKAKKTLSRANKPLGEVNVSSAFTFSCKQNNEIFIYREEEVLKVFIHETFHSFGLDFSSMSQNGANALLKQTFKGLDKNMDIRIYESYCETWAEVINILIISPNSTSFQHISRCLFYEMCWSLLQCSKVLDHLKLKYSNLFDSPPNQYTDVETCSFSYYILKSICLVNLNEFILLCNSQNKQTINFKQHLECVNNYTKFLCKFSKAKSFQESISRLQTKLHNNPKQFDLILSQTMRMSLYGTW